MVMISNMILMMINVMPMLMRMMTTTIMMMMMMMTMTMMLFAVEKQHHYPETEVTIAFSVLGPDLIQQRLLRNSECRLQRIRNL